MPDRGRVLLDPDVLAGFGMERFFVGRCTVQEDTGTTQDTDGARIESWTDLAGHVDIPCAVRPALGRELRREDSTITAAELRAGLQGNYPAITTKHRVVLEIVSAGTYDILHVERDSQALATYLDLEVVR